jgi:hypothetical protein
MVSSIPATPNQVENVFGQAPVRQGPEKTPPRPPARPQPVQDSVKLSRTGDADHDGDLK